MQRWIQMSTGMRDGGYVWVKSPNGMWVKTEDAYATADKLAGLLGEAHQLIHAMIRTNNDFCDTQMDPFRGAPDGEGSTLDRIRLALASYAQEMCWDKS